VLIAESSMKSKIRINDYNNFRIYNVRRVVFDTSLLDYCQGALPMNAFKGHPHTLTATRVAEPARVGLDNANC
jgi:hypothetical protein